ncbi:MAG TPA: stage III sporulation protein AD [Clostridia bacterium]|nr:stage III sporulation protein AD [Clostridia bacterium]
MEILQIVGIGIIAVILIITLKAQKPEIAMQISIVTGIVIFLLIASKLSAVIQLINSFAQKANINTGYISTLLKIIGIAYIVEFGSEVCRDAGESSVATKIELAGKVTIVLLAVPIITSLLDLIINLMP